MSNLGFGVMLGMLGGNEATVAAYANSKGKTIASVSLADNALTLQFTDGRGIVIRDDGQSCCEHRYMHTDDDLSQFSGSVLTDIELREGRDAEGEYGDKKESQFLIVKTSVGDFTCVNYNEHNGYYGGFWITIAER